MTTDSEYKDRRILQPWLERLLDNKEIAGLHWLNDEKTKFRIPWEHAGRRDWEPSKSQIFKEWAIQTGSYQPGNDDYSTWKQRLRNALQKARGIRYIESESNAGIDVVEPFRIYSMKRACVGRNIVKNAGARKIPKSSCSDNSESSMTSSILPPRVRISSHCIPTTVLEALSWRSDRESNCNSCNGSERLPSDLKDIKNEELIQPGNNDQLQDILAAGSNILSHSMTEYLINNQPEFCERQPSVGDNEIKNLTDSIVIMSFDDANAAVLNVDQQPPYNCYANEDRIEPSLAEARMEASHQVFVNTPLDAFMPGLPAMLQTVRNDSAAGPTTTGAIQTSTKYGNFHYVNHSQQVDQLFETFFPDNCGIVPPSRLVEGSGVTPGNNGLKDQTSNNGTDLIDASQQISFETINFQDLQMSV